VHPRPFVVQLGAVTLSTSPFSELRTADDQRRRRNSLAYKLTVEAKVLDPSPAEPAAAIPPLRRLNSTAGRLNWWQSLLSGSKKFRGPLESERTAHGKIHRSRWEVRRMQEGPQVIRRGGGQMSPRMRLQP
jgi:hypothetical protein